MAPDPRTIADNTRAQAPVEAVLTVVIVAVVALIGVLIVGTIVGGVIPESGADYEFTPTADQTETIDDQIEEEPAIFSVDATTGNAVQLPGEDADGTRSTVAFGAGDAVLDSNNGNATVVATGALDEGANGAATYNLVAMDNETLVVNYQAGNWTATYVDGAESAQASVPATSPTDLTTVAVRVTNQSGTHNLTIRAAGNQTTATADTNAESRPLQQDWYGTADDYRFIHVAASDSELATLTTDPVGGSALNHSARYMLDEGSGDTSRAFYSNSEATLLGGVTWTSGLSDPLVRGTDFTASFDPLEVTPLSGGLLEDAPIVYVTYESGLNAEVQAFASGFGDAIALIPILLIVTIAGVIVSITGRLRT